MPLLKSITLPNGSTAGFHKVHSLEWRAAGGSLVLVNSWASEDAYLSGAPLAYQSRLPLVSLDGTGDMLGALESWLVQQDGFTGATLIADSAQGLDAAKARQWAAIKQHRSELEYGQFTWDGSEFDCDRDSTAKIMGAVQTAMLSAQANQVFSVDWTLADNTTRTLSGADMISAGMTLMATVSDLYETSRTLREQIEAATTAEEVQAVTWPTGT